MSTLCTERSSVDQTSSTKQKITLVEGRSSCTRACGHLGVKAGEKREGEAKRKKNEEKAEVETHELGLVSGSARSMGILSLR